MNWLALVPSALSAASSLFGKKKKEPQYTPPPLPPSMQALYSQPLAPPTVPMPTFQGPSAYQAPARQDLSVYASELNRIAPLYDPSQGQVYRDLQAQMAGGLPAGYRQAVLGQAQREAQSQYDFASQSLGRERDRANRSAAEQMNKLGLLSSGALGVRQGLIDEAYGQQLGGLASQLQNQMGRVSVNLQEQELAQRDRIQALLAGIERDRASASQTARNSIASYAANEEASRQSRAQTEYENALRAAQSKYASELNAYNAAQQQYQQALANQSGVYNALAGQSAAQYQAQGAAYKSQWEIQQARQKNLLGALGNAASIYGMYRR